VLLHYLRRKQGKREVDFSITAVRDLGPSPTAALGERRERTLLLQALRSIPLDYQIVLELSYFEEMSRREIAEILDLPPGTVASRLRLGKDRLFAKIEELAASPALLESTMHDIQHWTKGLQAQLREE
jgi:RNA polymerase sigma-70 factor (ECF subfamily)